MHILKETAGLVCYPEHGSYMFLWNFGPYSHISAYSECSIFHSHCCENIRSHFGYVFI